MSTTTKTTAIERPSATPSPHRPVPGQPTRVAVVGAGYIADYHLEVLGRLPGIEVVCVCDLSLARAQEAARRFGVEHALSDLSQLSEHGVHVAHVLVPPDHHVAVTRQILDLGISAFVEKPLALHSAEARELEDLAHERGLVLAVNHNNVYHPSFQRLLGRLRSGAIGKVEHVQVTLSVPLRQLDAGDFSHWMFREPRNIVFEQAPHPFSQLVELVGAPRSAHASILGTRELNPGQRFHDRWLIAAEAERGTVEIYLAFGQAFTRSTITVLGSDGMLEADLHHDLAAEERKTQWLDFWNGFLAGWRRGGALKRSARRNLTNYLKLTLGLGSRQDAFFVGMRDSIHGFHASFRRQETPRTDGAHGRTVLEWCERCVDGLAPSAPSVIVKPSTTPARTGEVCVLGANGFIGKPTLRALAARDLPTTAVVRRRHSLPPEITAGVSRGNLRLALASLGDREALRQAVRGARVVVSLATGGGDSWEAIQKAMVDGTRALAEACLDEGIERLVYVSSTAALYLGADCGTDLLSDEVGPDPRPAGRALYARGKIAAEQELMRLHRERGLPVTIVRPAVVVGPGTPLQHSGLGLWTRDNHCVGWGAGTRPAPLVLAEDVADALARLAAYKGSDLDGKALNLASRQPLTPRELLRAYRQRSGRDFHFHPRALGLSQTMEIGKWIVKKIGGRKDAAFPSYRDLKSRSMHPELACERARQILGWKPSEDPETLLTRILGAPDA